MLGKPIDVIAVADLEALIRDRAEETQRLEFKREVDLTKERDKKEFAKDVSGMANGAGGRIIYGIDEGTSGGGRAVAERIIPLTDRHLIERANSILTDAITPPIRARIRPVDVEGGFVMIVDVPPSALEVHMVGAYNESRYYMRTEKSVVHMPEVEVRRAYDRIGRLRDEADERVRRVVEQERKLGGERTTILMIPLGSRRDEIDVTKFNDPSVWLPQKLRLANRPTVSTLLMGLKPTGVGLEAHAPMEKPLSEAVFVFRLLTDGTLHIGSPIVPLMTSGDRFQAMRLLHDVFNATAWAEIVCDKAALRGPVQVVVEVPVPRDLTMGGMPDDIMEPLVLPRCQEPIHIEYQWLPSRDVNARLHVVEAIMDRLWRHMGRERCDRFFAVPGRLQSRIAADLGI